MRGPAQQRNAERRSPQPRTRAPVRRRPLARLAARVFETRILWKSRASAELVHHLRGQKEGGEGPISSLELPDRRLSHCGAVQPRIQRGRCPACTPPRTPGSSARAAPPPRARRASRWRLTIASGSLSPTLISHLSPIHLYSTVSTVLLCL